MRKKILSALLALTLVFSMTACGNKEEIGGNRVIMTVDELKTKMSDALATVNSADIDMDFTLGGTAEASGQKMNLNIDLGGEAKFTVGNPAAYVKGQFSFKTSGDTKDNIDMNYSAEAYVNTEKEDINIFYNINDKGWYTSTSNMEDIMTSLDDTLSSLDMNEMDMSIFSGFFSTNTENVDPDYLPIITNKTVEAEGRECYEMTTKLGKSYLAGSAEGQAMYDMFDEYEGSMKLYIDVDTNLPIKMVYSFSMSAVTQESGMEMTVRIPNTNIEILAEYNTVDSIVVPEDIVNKAVNLSK